MAAKILIIEDDIVVATDIRQLLISVGYKITGIANNYEKGIELFNKEIPDLMICETGIASDETIIRFIKKSRGTESVPVIFLTATSKDAEHDDIFDALPDSILIKPFSHSQLLIAVRRIFYSMGKSDLFHKKIPAPSRREYEIIRCIANGYTSREIAGLLALSFETVQTHRKRIFKKYKVHSSAEIVMLAVRNHWLTKDVSSYN